jgi:transglutaminase-like putative cysteine protease
MPFVTIRHLTTYRYRRPVAFGEHRMMLHPRDSHDQRVIQADLRISPEPRSLRFVQDAFGNHVGIARFSRRSNELSFESVVCVEHSPRDGFGLEDAGRPSRVKYSIDELRDLAPYLERHQLDPIDAVGRWARELLFPSGATGAFELLTRLSRGIHHGFLYRRREAKGVQPPTETLRLGHGSCRDFAMLMIDATRSIGLAARFASGYLADRLMPGRKFIFRAPDGLISILQAAASATSTLSPLQLSLILATQSRFTAPMSDFRRTISAWRCK